MNNTINNLDLIDIYRTQLSTTAEYIVFSNVHRIFTKVGHLLDHKTYRKFQKCDILKNMFSEKKGIKLKYMVQLVLKISFTFLQSEDYDIQTEFTNAF